MGFEKWEFSRIHKRHLTEHREMAQACFEEIKKIFPLIENIIVCG
jgi:thymidylate synthase ThyX